MTGPWPMLAIQAAQALAFCAWVREERRARRAAEEGEREARALLAVAGRLYGEARMAEAARCVRVGKAESDGHDDNR